ncbi:MAG TPA: TolC family protein, partial [bacterium]|nr:TolC family protein [bacterium]
QYQFLQADEERARISEAQYATGILSFDNWIIIEDNLVRTRKSYLSVKAEALRAAAEWEYRTGLTIDKELSGEMQYP